MRHLREDQILLHIPLNCIITNTRKVTPMEGSVFTYHLLFYNSSLTEWGRVTCGCVLWFMFTNMEFL